MTAWARAWDSRWPWCFGAWPQWGTLWQDPLTVTFAIARGALGPFGESGLFPASIKTVAEWFPKKERALATGIFNAGTNAGAIITPLIVPWITIHLGWRWAFVFTGALGFAWLAFLVKVFYRKPEEQILRASRAREPSTTSEAILRSQ